MPNAQFSTLRHMFTGIDSGARLIDGSDFAKIFQLLLSADADVIGPAQLNAAVNEVSGGTEATLPPASSGRSLMVVNSSGGSLTIKAGAGDTITVAGGPVSFVTQLANVSSMYVCYDVGTWTQFSAGVSKAVADTFYVALGGATMTGPLILSGPPTDPLQAATKAYADLALTRLTAAEAKINTLEAKVSALEAKAANLEIKDTDLEARIETLEGGTP